MRRGPAALEFYAAAFGAVVDYKVGDDSIVAQLSVGDASFWVADESPEYGNYSARDGRWVHDADAPDRRRPGRGRRARASPPARRSVHAAEDEYGWRLGRVLDPFGHHWEIGKPLGPWPPSA